MAVKSELWSRPVGSYRYHIKEASLYKGVVLMSLKTEGFSHQNAVDDDCEKGSAEELLATKILKHHTKCWRGSNDPNSDLQLADWKDW